MGKPGKPGRTTLFLSAPDAALAAPIAPLIAVIAPRFLKIGLKLLFEPGEAGGFIQVDAKLTLEQFVRKPRQRSLK